MLQAREGPITVDSLKKVLSDKREKETLETLEFLKIYNVVREITYNGEKLIVLICLIQLDTKFPDYLNLIIPKTNYLSINQTIKPNKKEYHTAREILEDFDVELEAVSTSEANLEKAPPLSEINFEGTIFQGKTLEFKKPSSKHDITKPKEKHEDEVDWTKTQEEDDKAFISDQLRSLLLDGFFESPVEPDEPEDPDEPEEHDEPE